MNLLSTQDREYVLKQLQSAPDHILVDAMLALNEARVKTIEVRGLCGELQNAVGIDPAIPGTEKTVDVEVTPRRNLNPGAPSIGKIGSETKDTILKMLVAGTQPPKKYEEHLKLLWSRGEVKFDGQEYYL